MKLCSVEGCDRKHKSKGYCDNHYRRLRIYGDPLYFYVHIKRTCLVESCNEGNYGHGYCKKHYEQWKATGNPIPKIIRMPLPDKCDFERCRRKPLAKRLCKIHYERYKKHGYLKITHIDMTPKEIFMSKIKINEVNGCWEWQDHIGPLKYGHIKVKNKMWIASRYSYHLLVGNIPDGLFVLHRCDNPSCVNPDHLFLGTQKDNMQDMIKKGRGKLIKKTIKTGDNICHSGN